MAWRLKKIFPIEGLTLFYVVATALYMLVWPGAVDKQIMLSLLGIRLLVVTAILLFNLMPLTKFMALIRQVMPAALILHWYPETYHINSCLFANLDSFFMKIDGLLFCCQPSLEFSSAIPWVWFSELMNFTYISFYVIINVTVFYLYYKEAAKGAHAAFMLLFAFMSYYVLFILIPVIGPQYHITTPEEALPYSWPFRAFLRILQEMGEKPTGAFPSSHVGVTIICLIILYVRKERKLCSYFLPLSVLLIASTVYIKAHYLIDVVAGLLTAPLFYWLGLCVWKKVGGQGLITQSRIVEDG
ncbi:MAG: phosphatase PAP2 family protein [Bacteroidales bacterium]|nr:phosphatase PAP2 family protein [Bacteroidales bacterium]MCL2133365.1 phosphatase PAP2 family protein [Bacteroidales bacterium]